MKWNIVFTNLKEIPALLKDKIFDKRIKSSKETNKKTENKLPKFLNLLQYKLSKIQLLILNKGL